MYVHIGQIAAVRDVATMQHMHNVILQELIQNADDAGAKIVRFYIDQRPSKAHSGSFAVPELLAYQGPALLAANDAVFSEKDWEGIERLQDSVKADDPFNVGKFGIGFNAVYHITGKNLL